MAAQNVHQKSQMSVYTCTTPTKSNLDSGEPGTSVLEGRYACVLRIIGFTHYIPLPIEYNKVLPKVRFNFVSALQTLFHSFCGRNLRVTQLASSGSGILTRYSNQDIYLVCSPLPGQSIEDPLIRWLAHRLLAGARVSLSCGCLH